MAAQLDVEDDYAGESDASAEHRPSDDPTGELYPELQQAYQFFNGKLFDGQLPYVLITLQRKHSSEAYWSPSRFSTVAGALTGELAMNPRYLAVRSPTEILSVLVHEQVHVWQTYFGKPGRRGYHNRQWADKMKEIGLYPSSTDMIGGDETGEHMGHYIIDGGPFETASKQLIESGFVFTWYDRFPARPSRPIGRSSDVPVASPAAVPQPSAQDDRPNEDAPVSVVPAAKITGEQSGNDLQQQSPLDTVKPEQATTISSLLARPKTVETPATMYPGLQLQMPQQNEQQPRNRNKFQCPNCKQSAWGKKTLAISCTPCQIPMGDVL